MITSSRVFEDAYLPRSLLHREGEVEHLCRVLQPAVDGDVQAMAAVDDVIVSGPSGVGKTVLARHTLERFEERTEAYHAHVRCLGRTTTQVLREILTQHPRARASRFSRNNTVDELRAVLDDVVDEPLVVILDEADGLEASTVDALTGIAGLSLVLICHEPERLLARLVNALDHRRFARLHLDRYGVDELADILEARADIGLPDEIVLRAQLETIADDAAGVARRGIQMLRAAAELAAERNHGEIEPADIEDSYGRARRRIRESNLGSLPFHHQVLYAIVHEAGEIEARELHERYDMIAEDVYQEKEWTPIGKRARRNKLAKLQEYDLIGISGPDHSRRYGVLDQEVGAQVAAPSFSTATRYQSTTSY